MRFLNTKIHGCIDYLVGALFIAMPWILNLDPSAPAGAIFMILGVMAVIYSIFTNYELGIIRILSVKTHLLLDILSGIVLAASPWIFGFSEEVYVPHVAFGLFEIVAGLITHTKAWANSSVERNLTDRV
jgi:hypothetical protein